MANDIGDHFRHLRLINAPVRLDRQPHGPEAQPGKLLALKFIGIREKNHISRVRFETVDIHPARVRVNVATTQSGEVTVEF